MRVPWLAATAACTLALACADDSELTRASAHAQRHLPAFARFERWADRALADERAAGQREAVSELLFSQLRGKNEVIAAFVRVRGDAPLELALPDGATLDAAPRWLLVRDPERGAVRVALESRCPIALAGGRAPGEPAPCVLISNAEAAAGDATRAITIAFRD